MHTLIHAFAIVIVVLLFLIVAAKVAVSIVRTVRPDYLPRWFAVTLRIVPSWRLFGQGGAIFDLYEVIGDRIGDEPEHFHTDNGRSRAWFHVAFNPHSRYRYVRRELMQSHMYYQLSELPDRPANRRAISILEEVARDEIARHHPDDHGSRTATLYVVVDRGFFSETAPEAKVAIGPLEPRDTDR